MILQVQAPSLPTNPGGVLHKIIPNSTGGFRLAPVQTASTQPTFHQQSNLVSQEIAQQQLQLPTTAQQFVLQVCLVFI